MWFAPSNLAQNSRTLNVCNGGEADMLRRGTTFEMQIDIGTVAKAFRRRLVVELPQTKLVLKPAIDARPNHYDRRSGCRIERRTAGARSKRSQDHGIQCSWSPVAN